MEKNTTRTKISNFVKQVRDVGGPGALLGGESLPPTLVYEEMLTHFSDRPLFHLDGEIKLTEEHVLETMREAMEKGGALLVTLTMKVGRQVFKPLERLLRDGQLDVNTPFGWLVVSPKDNFRLVIHSKPGGFPFDESVVLRLNLEAL